MSKNCSPANLVTFDGCCLVYVDHVACHTYTPSFPYPIQPLIPIRSFIIPNFFQVINAFRVSVNYRGVPEAPPLLYLKLKRELKALRAD